jgi:hypothetical protein
MWIIIRSHTTHTTRSEGAVIVCSILREKNLGVKNQNSVSCLDGVAPFSVI